MGLVELVHVDARDVAKDLGIEVIWLRHLPWLVSSVGGTIIVKTDNAESVEQERLWEGIAQCLLTRLGIEWTASQIKSLGPWLSSLCQSHR